MSEVCAPLLPRSTVRGHWNERASASFRVPVHGYAFWCVLFVECLLLISLVAGHGEDGLYESMEAIRCHHDDASVPLSQLSVIETIHVHPSENKHKSLDSGWPSSLSYLRSRVAKSDADRRHTKFYVIDLFDHGCQREGQTVRTYDNVDVVCAEEDVLTPAKVMKVKEILANAIKYLSSALLVTPVAKISVPAKACGGIDNAAMTIADHDFVFFVSSVPGRARDTTVAWALSCGREQPSNRPIIGHINFLPSAIKTRMSSTSNHVAIHELTHALGFSDLFNTLKNYYDLDGKYHNSGGTAKVRRDALGKTVALVQTPRVLAAARAHFGCPTLDGVEIEDMGPVGTSGSHWKKRLFYDEAMVGVISSHVLYYSSMTLAFFEDAGFYTVDYDYAEDNSLWGYQKGCDFTTQPCNVLYQREEADEFCFKWDDKSFARCTNDLRGFGYCDVTRFSYELPSIYSYFSDPHEGGSLESMDYCPAVVPYSNTDCLFGDDSSAPNIYGAEYGEGSRCFISSIITSAFPIGRKDGRCFLTACTPSGQLLLRIQGETVRCPSDGSAGPADTSHLWGVHGSIACPVASEICRGQDNTGLSFIPTGVSPAVPLSPLNFTLSFSDTCQQRASHCEQQDILQYHPHCRLLVSKLIDCFGTDCPDEIRSWIDKHLAGTGSRCQSSLDVVANVCLDSWLGAYKLCGVASSSVAPAFPWCLGMLLAFSLLCFM